ncbi:MAG TPA: hypothetical protein VEK79_20750 [Thermoanaerobaculia bacterium]|nr:hypothetical protein [Thermoanaerobaculia bacterium]
MLRAVIAVFVSFVIAGMALAHPGAGIAVGADGRVYFVDTGGGLFSLDRNGRVTRHQGPAFHWFAFDPARRFRQTSWPYIPGAELRSSDVFVLSSDFSVAIGTDAIFYFPEGSRERGVRIVGIAPNGTRTVRATLPPIRNDGSTVWWINGLAAGPGGSLYYTEDRAVRRIDTRGRVSTVADRVAVPNCIAIPGVPPIERPYLRGLAVTPDGTVYVAAAGCGALLKISAGKVTPILRTQAPWSPTAVAVANGEVYVLEYSHTASDNRLEWFPRVRKIARDGKVTMLGGTPRR